MNKELKELLIKQIDQIRDSLYKNAKTKDEHKAAMLLLQAVVLLENDSMEIK